MVAEENGSGVTNLQLSRGAFGATLRVTTTRTGDLQWLSLPLAVPGNLSIKSITVCYELSHASSYISQVRLVQESVPPSALIVHDDPTDLTSTDPVCVESAVNNHQPQGAMTLSLRLNYADTAHHIDIGAIGLVLGE